eukprot:834481-Pleurochrysis_carterae.AAC.3
MADARCSYTTLLHAGNHQAPAFFAPEKKSITYYIYAYGVRCMGDMKASFVACNCAFMALRDCHQQTKPFRDRFDSQSSFAVRDAAANRIRVSPRPRTLLTSFMAATSQPRHTREYSR